MSNRTVYQVLKYQDSHLIFQGIFSSKGGAINFASELVKSLEKMKSLKPCSFRDCEVSVWSAPLNCPFTTTPVDHWYYCLKSNRFSRLYEKIV